MHPSIHVRPNVVPFDSQVNRSTWLKTISTVSDSAIRGYIIVFPPNVIRHNNSETATSTQR